MAIVSTQQGNTRGFFPRRSIPVGDSFVAFITCAALLFVLRFDSLPAFSTEAWGGTVGDAGLYRFLIQSNLRDFLSLPWFNTTMLYPYSKTLAWSDNYLFPSFLTGAFLHGDVSFTAAWNAALALAAILAGWCTFRCAFVLTGQLLPSVTAGVGFMAWPYFIDHLGHSQLQWSFVLPLGTEFFLRFFTNFRVRWAVLMGVAWLLALLSSVYYFVYLSLLYGVLTIAVFVLRPGQLSGQAVRRLFFGFLPSVFVALPFLFPYLEVKEVFGGRHLHEAYFFSATSASYLTPAPSSSLYGALGWLSHPESRLFPGLLPLLGGVVGIVAILFTLLTRYPFSRERLGALVSLAGVVLSILLVLWAGFPDLAVPETRRGVDYAKKVRAVWDYTQAAALWLLLFSTAGVLWFVGRLERQKNLSSATRTAAVLVLLVVVVLFATLSMGPLGFPEIGRLALGPYAAFHHILPGTRVPGRLGVVVALFLWLLTAVVIARLVRGGGVSRLSRCALLVVVVLESIVRATPATTFEAAPLVFSQAKTLPDQTSPVVVLPMAREVDHRGRVKSWMSWAVISTKFMNWSFPLNRPMVNGYSGIGTGLMRRLPGATANFPDARSLSVLKRMAGLRYVVYVPSAHMTWDRAAFLERLKTLSHEVRFISGDDQGNMIFELTGALPVKPRQGLLVPSWPLRTVSFRLSTPLPRSEEVTVSVVQRVVQNQKRATPRTSPPRTIVVPAGAREVEVRFPLAPLGEEIEPYELLLEPPPGQPFFIEDVRVSVQ